MALFSAVRYTLCDTYIDFPQYFNSGKSIFKTSRHKAILQGKGESGLSFTRIDEITVSRLPEMEKWKRSLIRQIFKPLKMVLCSFCDSFPLKLKKKQAGLHFTSADYLSLILTPFRIRWTIPLIFACIMAQML